MLRRELGQTLALLGQVTQEAGQLRVWLSVTTQDSLHLPRHLPAKVNLSPLAWPLAICLKHQPT